MISNMLCGTREPTIQLHDVFRDLWHWETDNPHDFLHDLWHEATRSTPRFPLWSVARNNKIWFTISSMVCGTKQEDQFHDFLHGLWHEATRSASRFPPSSVARGNKICITISSMVCGTKQQDQFHNFLQRFPPWSQARGYKTVPRFNPGCVQEAQAESLTRFPHDLWHGRPQSAERRPPC